MAARAPEGGAERELTRRLAHFFATDDARVEIGIGDDGAVVRTSPRSVLVCDPVVEGVHFTRADPLSLVGRKVVNRNLSDLAAMGATPDYLLVSLLLPAWLTREGRRRLVEGIRHAAREAASAVVGGDVAATPGPLVVTVCALGTAPRRCLRRDGLRAGDRLHVTGPLGGSRLGRHLRFLPQLAAGRWLAGQPMVHAAIDVSDGLLLDLAAMLAASGGLGAELDAAAIPIAPAAVRAAKASGRTPLAHALTDGEDHELLFNVRGRLGRGGPLAGAARRPLGSVRAAPGIDLIDADGRRRRLAVEGYQHDV